MANVKAITQTIGLAANSLKDKELFDQIRKLGLTVRKQDGEYRVAFKGRMNEDSAYYTDDRQDALDTAKRMLEDRPMH